MHIALCFAMLASWTAGGEDWPMWRCDAQRSAVSAEKLPEELHLQWVRHYPPLKPAFRSKRLQFDGGYEPVASGKRLFVASSRNDSITALDIGTGKELWRFFTGGPVRFAPVAWKGKVYAGSDDGYLYCLDAKSGALRWKFKAVPSDRKVIGNDRLISLWPLRGGPVLADGTIYFAAGVWPFEGVFVYALNAETGTVVWMNDRAGFLYGVQPHNARAMGGLTPQGYLVINGDDLLVPCGTALPAVFDRRTGKLKEFKLTREGRVPGGWFASIGAINSEEAKAGRRGELLVDADINREEHEDTWKQGPGKPAVRSTVSIGGRPYSFSDELPGVTGEIYSMLAANGKLVVSTREGGIYCLGAESGKPKIYARQDKPNSQRVNSRNREILAATGVQHGYALVWGIDDGSLVKLLAQETALQIIAVEANAGKVSALRRELDEAGLYGSRASVLQGDPLALGLPKYMASLVVSEKANPPWLDASPRSVETLFDVLRPYGGAARLFLSRARQQAFARDVTAAKLANADLQQSTRKSPFTILKRSGALPGSDNYTGGFSSSDELVRAPLGVLWFGDSIGMFKRSPQPSIIDGVMIANDKKWQDEPRPHVAGNLRHLPGSSIFDLEETAFMDVYTGRLLAESESAQVDPGNLLSDLSADSQANHYPTVAEGQKVKLEKGERINPLTGRKEPRTFIKSHGCEGSLRDGIDYGDLITMRSATAAYYDKTVESGTVNISGTRSGCTNSVIPANGLLNVPFFYEGCTCSYPLPSGLALVHMPEEYEQWCAWGEGQPEDIERVGINLGAPGDRMTRNGTLWLDYPSVGGPSPEIAVSVEPDNPEFYYHHSVWVEGGEGWPWVAASGAKGITSVTIAGLKTGAYTVRVYFAEPDGGAPDARVFDVALQGRTVLEALDIAKETGGRMRGLVKEFKGVQADGVMRVQLAPRKGVGVLSGIEIIAEGLQSARRELIDLRNSEQVIARRPLLIAHRGGVISSDSPECSLAAIRAASRFGYDLVELDIQESADGEPIVFHDDSLYEACGVEGTVAALTAKKLKTITFSANGEPIPHLQDALALCAAERLGVMLDIKSDGGEAFFGRIIGLLERYQLTRATLCIGNTASVRPYFGDRIMLRVSDKELASLDDDDAADLSGKFWFGLPPKLPSEMVAKYQESGLLVIPALNTFRYDEQNHLVDAKGDSIRLRNANVDGFQIDSVYQDFFIAAQPE